MGSDDIGTSTTLESNKSHLQHAPGDKDDTALKLCVLPADRHREPSPRRSGRTQASTLTRRSPRNATQCPQTSSRGGDPTRRLYGCGGTEWPRVGSEPLLYRHRPHIALAPPTGGRHAGPDVCHLDREGL